MTTPDVAARKPDDVYIVSLQFDSDTFEWLQTLRTQHFPPSRNYLPAHLTLLHTASVEQIDRLKHYWTAVIPPPPPALRFTGLRSLGGGTALVVEAPGLVALRADIMRTMGGAFTRQDQQTFKPHVTIQNKVESATARSLLEQLKATFVAREGTGSGLMIWLYLGGPWSLNSVLPCVG